ncbi:MAG TPA: FAD-dependent oxidoreductase [Solirubrobacterales bacterium]|nr:FAD-dependent oxidoreductase [Solirubrobacterales bacterium]
MKTISPWHDGPERTDRPALAGDIQAEVVVIGAGIVGLTAAYLLRRAHVDVILLEARHIASGTTGNTTAKLSSLHGLTYASLASSHGAEVAATYARANEGGIDRVASLIEGNGIECAFRRRDNFTYTLDEGQVGDIEEEAEAARAAGLDADVVTDTELPFPIAAAVRVPGQADFNPVRYLQGLADAVDDDGPRIYESTRAVDVERDAVITAAGHRVACERVIVATHLPFIDSGGLFARPEPKRSYAVTARLDGPVPQHMYLSAGSPTRSLRSVPREGGELLLVGGESHRVGSGDPREHFDALREWGSEHFPVVDYEHRWAAHDFISEDGLPYVGAASAMSDRALTVTGLKMWGLAMGTSCAAMLVDGILGADDPWPAAFDSRRRPKASSLGKLVKHNAESGAHFFADRLRRAGRDGLEPGEGRVVGSGLGQSAVYVDDDGEVHELSARCTHLGCIVQWNAAERTWDCPCHGSRYEATGEVLEGPATRPLSRRTDPGRGSARPAETPRAAPPSPPRG